MSDEPRTKAREAFAALLPRIMEDGHVDEAEKLELRALFSKGVLTVGDVKQVLGSYLKSLQDEVLADGIVTEEEQTKVRAVVRELAIPRALLSPELQAIVDDKPLGRRT